jgi:hypothetical protein
MTLGRRSTDALTRGTKRVGPAAGATLATTRDRHHDGDGDRDHDGDHDHCRPAELNDHRKQKATERPRWPETRKGLLCAGWCGAVRCVPIASAERCGNKVGAGGWQAMTGAMEPVIGRAVSRRWTLGRFRRYQGGRCSRS